MGSGGKREGSGRKSANPGEKRVQMVITIEPETRNRLKEIAESKDIPVGRFIDTIVETFYMTKK